MRDSPNRRVLCGHRRCEGLSKKTRESSATETKWGPYPLSTHVNFSLTFPQVLWISPGKLWAEGIFLFLFQPSDSFCLIFKHPLFFGILFMGAARRAAQGDCKSPLSAPLENLAISTGLMRSLCSQAMYDCRAVYKQRWEEKDFQKETQTGLTFLFKAIRSLPKINDDWNVVCVACDKALLPEATHKRAWWAFWKSPPWPSFIPDENKRSFKRDVDRGNVPIQNLSVFIKDNDDWVGVISCRVSQGNSLFMEWRELSSNILKMGEARLHIASGNGSMLQAT